VTTTHHARLGDRVRCSGRAGVADGVRRRGEAGFTLIELVVVMAVVAIVTSAVAVGIGNIRGASVQTEAGQLAVAVRYLYNLSILNGRNYRLVLDLENGNWWGEAQASRDPCTAFLLPGDGEEEDKAVDEDDEDAAPKAAGFDAAKSKLLAKHKLAKGIVVRRVMTSHQSDFITSGQAHINFFPNGTVERGFVVFTLSDDEDDAMSVEILPLQGSARVLDGELDIDDFLDDGN
jgi:type II secretion system protein H